MVLNKKGQVIFFTFMISIVVVVLALALAYPVRQVVDQARSNSTETSQGLDCNNSSISNFQKGQCVITDLATPYFFFALLGIAGVIIGAKVVFQ